LIFDYDTCEIHINGKALTDMPEVPKSIIRSPGYQQNFIATVKSRTPSESNLAYVRKLKLLMHLGIISYRLKRKLQWDSEKECFMGDKEADGCLYREYRSK
jgi:hypothetical protein